LHLLPVKIEPKKYTSKNHNSSVTGMNHNHLKPTQLFNHNGPKKKHPAEAGRQAKDASPSGAADTGSSGTKFSQGKNHHFPPS